MKHTLTLIDLGVASKKTQGTTGGQFSDAALGCAPSGFRNVDAC